MPTTVVVSDTGAAPASTGMGSTLKWVLLGGAALVAVYFLWSYLSGSQGFGQPSTSTGGGGTSGGGGGGSGGTGGNPANTTTTPPPAAPVGATSQGILALIQNAGTYVNSATGKISQGTGLGNLFVTTGNAGNMDFPLGSVITTSRDLTTAEQTTVLQNLITSGISGWWNQGSTAAASPAAATPASNPAVPPVASSTTIQAAGLSAGANPPAQAVQAAAPNPVLSWLSGAESAIAGFLL